MEPQHTVCARAPRPATSSGPSRWSGRDDRHREKAFRYAFLLDLVGRGERVHAATPLQDAAAAEAGAAGGGEAR